MLRVYYGSLTRVDGKGAIRPGEILELSRESCMTHHPSNKALHIQKRQCLKRDRVSRMHSHVKQNSPS